MKYIKRPFFYVICLWSLVLGASATVCGQILPIRNYSLIDGMPESTVRSVVEDHLGYIWIATQGGVSRFDGRKFETFTTEHGLPSNNISCIFIDNQKQLWVGTRAGIGRFDGKRFKTLNKADGLISDDITCIYQDSYGNYWFGTADGITRLDAKGYTNYSGANGLRDTHIWSITEDSQKNVWFATSEGIHVFNGRSFMVYDEQNGLPSRTINHLYRDSQLRIWISTSAGVGLYSNGKFKSYTIKDGLPTNLVWYVIEEQNKRILIATAAGVVLYQPENNKFQPFLRTQNGLTGNEINCMLRDSGRNLWVGTDVGLSKLSVQTFETYDDRQLRLNTSVWAVFCDSKGGLWFGTTGEGLIQFSALDSVRYHTIAQGLPSNYVRAINEDAEGNLWLATYGGVSKYDGRKFSTYTKEDGLPDNTVFTVLPDPKGDIWFGTDKGISRFDGKTFTNYTTAQGLANNYVRTTLIDRKGRLWIGTYGGISCFDGKKFTNYTTAQGLPNNLVLSILEDRQGQLWFATENGLCYLKPNAKPGDPDSFVCYDRKDGLSSQGVWLLIEDNNGKLWAGHRTGIEKFDPKAKKFQYYGYLEGFQLIQTYPNAVAKDKSGNLWFGALNGVVKYKPKEDRINTIAPRTHITEVRLSNNPQAVDWLKLRADSIHPYFNIPLSTRGEKRPAVVLPYNKNHLTFDFVGIHFTVPEKVRYRYKLEGFEKDWSTLSELSSVNYTNLKPGDYTFIVEAYNHDGVTSEIPTSFRFRIAPPYWERWWFYLIQLVIFSSLIGASIYFTTRKRRSPLTIILTLITLLVVVEFINVQIEGYVDQYTQSIPLFKIAVNVCVAALFMPLEHLLRKRFEHPKTRVTPAAKD